MVQLTLKQFHRELGESGQGHSSYGIAHTETVPQDESCQGHSVGAVAHTETVPQGIGQKLPRTSAQQHTLLLKLTPKQ